MSNRTPDPLSKLAREVLKPLRSEKALAYARASTKKSKSLLPELVERARKAVR